MLCYVVEFENKLLSNFEYEWVLKLNQLPKLGLYKNIKQNYNMENNIPMNIPKSHRSLVAQFRCGILPIRIETVRYRGEPVSDRLCTLRSQDNAEDEYHFLLYCLKYSILRTDFFNNIGYVSSPLMSDLDCVKFLLTSFPRQTAKFINL